MKAMIFLVALSGLTAVAQPPQNPSDVSDPTRGRVELRSKARPSVSIEKQKKTSGVVAQAVRAKNPLKLIDPRAPREAGEANENVSRDPITGRAEGIRVFTVSF